MTPIVQLRKDPRALSAVSEGQSGHTARIASTHIPPFVLKILGLKSAT
jgi:hypothetical protein